MANRVLKYQKLGSKNKSKRFLEFNRLQEGCSERFKFLIKQNLKQDPDNDEFNCVGNHLFLK